MNVYRVDTVKEANSCGNQIESITFDDRHAPIAILNADGSGQSYYRYSWYDEIFSVNDHSFTIPPGADESRLRIINGDKAGKFDWPWQVALQKNNSYYDGQEGFAKHLKLKVWA